LVSEKKIVEIVDTRRRRTTKNDGWGTTDIQGITKAHPEHSSGELKKFVNFLAVTDLVTLKKIWHSVMHKPDDVNIMPLGCNIFHKVNIVKIKRVQCRHQWRLNVFLKWKYLARSTYTLA